MRVNLLTQVSYVVIAFATAGVATCPSVSQADDAKPTVVMGSGQVRLQFADGREAVLKETVIKNVRVGIPFSINENTCNGAVGAKCTYTAPFNTHYFFFAWSKHPDAGKMNHELVVPATANNSENKIEFQAFLGSLQKKLFPAIAELGQVPAQSISCSDYNWFEPNDLAHPGLRKIRSVSSETNIMNTETKVEENRFFSTVRDVVLTAQSDKTLQITDGSLPPSLATTIPLLFFGDSAWYVKTRTGEVCQFTARAQFTSAVSEFNAIDSKRNAPENPTTTYTYGNSDNDGFYKIDSQVADLVNSNSWGNVQ